MKPDRRTASPASIASIVLTMFLGACVSPVQAPIAAPPPVHRAPPPQVKPPLATDWHDNVATPGVWQWSRDGRLTVSRFGTAQAPAVLRLTCDSLAHTIRVSRSGSGSTTASTMTIRTTSLSRVLPTRNSDDGAIISELTARDPLLDAMAFSRGRFAVEVSGLAPIYLPSWPEVGRVIEDCR
jgi:hypothetical protein